MTPERWQQINTLLDAVMELPPVQQQAYLDQHCAGDPELRREVFSLLEAGDQADTFLEAPAKEYAAPLIPSGDDTVTDLMVGREIDGYRILDVLGRGGMGVVYKAHDVNLDKVVALKMINPELARDPSFVRRFRSEARALARIDSPYIVRVHAMRQTDAGLYIIMEYVDGGTVTDLLQGGGVSWQRARPIVRQMLMALEQAHSVGVIHRDIKPSNIMLTQQGKVKVTDFGLAKLHQDGMTTATQGISGTLFYMSPEQVQGLTDLDHRSDLYSMGMTIYQMLAGALPLDRDTNQFAVMRAIVEEEVPLVSKVKPELPRHVVEAVKTSLEKDRGRRFQSAAEMRIAFDRGQPAVAADDDTIVTEAYEPPTPGRKWPLYLGSGTVLVVALALAAWFFGPWTSDAPRLSVTTSPPDADVYLDGRAIGSTPLSDYRVDREAGQVLLRIRKNDYVTVDTALTLVAGTTLSLDLSLTAIPDTTEIVTPTRGTLRLSSNVGDARVRINDRDVGRTDANRALSDVEVEPGAVVVAVSKNGYKLWRETHQVVAGETLPLTARLERDVSTDPDNGTDPDPPPSGTLTLNVPDGSLSVAGEPSCRAGSACTVTAGTKTVTFRHPRYGERTMQVRVRAGQSNRQTFYFERKINIQARDVEGGEIYPSIWVNNRTDDWFAPRQLTRGPGEYTIEARKEGYEAQNGSRRVVIEPGFDGEPIPVMFQMRKL